MAYRDTEIVPIPQVPGAASVPAPPDWRRQCEQALERAEAAEARAEELKSAELSARTDLGYWKSQFQAARRKRLEAVEDANQVRRAAKALRREVHRLRKAVPEAKAQAAEIDGLRKALRKGYKDQAQLRHLLHEALRLHDKLKGRYRSLRTALKRTVDAKEGFKARLRRATRAVLSKALYGRRSEMRERPGTGRPRGQVRGAPGHGRTPRPGLEERVEEHNPPEEARICAGCGKRYAAVGAEQSALVEIEVKAHRRVIRRGRWRRTCDCASSPVEVTAPPVPRLFPNTSYGVSVWSRVLYERYACLRPVQRVGAWLGDQGLPVAAGTLADSVPRFVPLFEPLGEAILAHQNTAVLRHADETTWRVQALRTEGRSARRLAVGLGRQRRYVLPHRPEPQRRGGADSPRGTPVRHGARLRPLQRLQEAGAPARRHGDPAVLLGICCGPDYVAESRHRRTGHEDPRFVRNIIF